MNAYSFLADIIVIVHLAYVGFVVLGLIAILVGVVFRWNWIRNFWFRLLHLTMIAIVVMEALFGMVCPLTTWEHDLRIAAGETVQAESFVARWVHSLLFFEAPQWVFTVCYCLFGAVVLSTFLLAPPSWPTLLKRRDEAA